MKNNTLFYIFITLLIINGMLIYSNIPKLNNTIKTDKITTNVFKITNVTTTCDDYEEELFKDSEYTYYLVCSKSSNITIKYFDGDVYTLKDMLENKYLTIDNLINSGLIIKKVPINNESIPNDNSVENNSKPEVNNNNSNTETKPDNNTLTNPNSIILTTDEILEYNKKIINKTDMYYDINNIKSLSKGKIKEYITTYNLPKLPKYDGELELNSTNTQSVLDNLALDNIIDLNSITKGIIVKRTNLRSFPTNIHFYDNKNKKDFDRLQETELHVNTPILIIHESLDKEWYFVISPFYAGWVLKDNVAYAKEEDINYLINNKNFIVIIEPVVNINNVTLDMSVKLPFVGSANNNLNVILPTKGSDGFVKMTNVSISNDKASIGYLSYTKKNIIELATKYLGTKYSWGGLDSGVDCSSFVSNVYRAFGFTFPRNTSSQNKSVGSITSLENKTTTDKLNLIKNMEPSLLFQSGHVMLYIGDDNNKPYIIHALGSDMQVVKTELTVNSSYLKKINRLVLVGK